MIITVLIKGIFLRTIVPIKGIYFSIIPTKGILLQNIVPTKNKWFAAQWKYMHTNDDNENKDDNVHIYSTWIIQISIGR